MLIMIAAVLLVATFTSRGDGGQFIKDAVWLGVTAAIAALIILLITAITAANHFIG